MINQDCRFEPIPAADFVEKNKPVRYMKEHPVYFTACIGETRNKRTVANARARRQLDKLYDGYEECKRRENQGRSKRSQELHFKLRKM